MNNKGKIIDIKRDIFIIIIVAWCLCFVFFLGRASFYYEIIKNRPPPEVVTDINVRIPVFSISDIREDYLRASVNFDGARIVFNDEVYLVGSDREFEIKRE